MAFIHHVSHTYTPKHELLFPPKIASRTKVGAFQQDCLLESSEIEYRYIFWYEQGVRPNRVGTTMITLLAFCTGYYGFIGYKPTQHNHIHGVYKWRMDGWKTGWPHTHTHKQVYTCVISCTTTVKKHNIHRNTYKTYILYRYIELSVTNHISFIQSSDTNGRTRKWQWHHQIIRRTGKRDNDSLPPPRRLVLRRLP